MLVVLAVVSAWAHARLSRSEPLDGATVTRPPRIDLWFDGHVERRFHELTLVGGAKDVPLQGVVDLEDPTRFGAALPELPPGTWTVRYEVVSRDGHRVDGQVRFTVR